MIPESIDSFFLIIWVLVASAFLAFLDTKEEDVYVIGYISRCCPNERLLVLKTYQIQSYDRVNLNGRSRQETERDLLFTKLETPLFDICPMDFGLRLTNVEGLPYHETKHRLSRVIVRASRKLGNLTFSNVRYINHFPKPPGFNNT